MRGFRDTVAVALILALAVLSAAAYAQEQPITGDCASCHGDEAVLPRGHVDTSGMSWETCAACHPDSDPDLNLAGSMPLSHLHGLRGVDCASCHGDQMDEPESDTCETCHGSMADLAQVDWEGKPNPHDSHYPGLECTFCHHAHEPSEDFCRQCHNFGYQIP